jgi:hypothetical protein
MIEYLYSRMILVIAAVGISGLVIVATVGSGQGAIRSLAEEIAGQFVQLVSTATRMSCEYFSADFVITDLPFSLDARVIIRQQSITVSIGEYRAIGIFEDTVNLVEGNESADALEFSSRLHGVCVISEKNILSKFNRVTLVLIDIPN